MHSTGTGQPVETQDVFFWRLAGRSAPTGLAIVHWIGCINAIKLNYPQRTSCANVNVVLNVIKHIIISVLNIFRIEMGSHEFH